jgi:NAD+ diphosphatase
LRVVAREQPAKSPRSFVGSLTDAMRYAAKWLKSSYSVLAGFVEPGESIEEAVVREVREEVGIEVTNVRYFGSQPWPFPNSLMIGFTAEYTGGDLNPQPGEIEDAGWYTADDLPKMPPKLSIARAMIDDFVRQQGLDPEGPETPG